MKYTARQEIEAVQWNPDMSDMHSVMQETDKLLQFMTSTVEYKGLYRPEYVFEPEFSFDCIEPYIGSLYLDSVKIKYKLDDGSKKRTIRLHKGDWLIFCILANWGFTVFGDSHFRKHCCTKEEDEAREDLYLKSKESLGL